MKPFFRILFLFVCLLAVALEAQSVGKSGVLLRTGNPTAEQTPYSISSSENPQVFFFAEVKEESGISERLRDFSSKTLFLSAKSAKEKTVSIVQFHPRQNIKKAFVPLYIRGQALLC